MLKAAASASHSFSASSLAIVLAVLISGCVSSKPAQYLVPDLENTAVIRTTALVVPCDFVTNTYDLWWRGSSGARCIEPRAQVHATKSEFEVLEVGQEFVDIRAQYVNGVDSAYCLLTGKIDNKPYVVWDIHIEAIFGLRPIPKKSNWFCHSIRTHGKQIGE